MAADRQRLAQALAAEAARRRLFESIPEAAGQGLPQAPEVTNYGRDLENLSIGLGRGAVNQLEGLKGLVTSPVESVKGIVSGVGEAIRNPRMIAEALQRTGERAASGPLGLGEVVGENFNMARVPSAKPVMSEINVYHGSPHKFDAFDASKIGTGEGAQAYGHGIYFAESPDTAAYYKGALTDRFPAELDGKSKQELTSAQKSALGILNDYGGNVDSALVFAKRDMKKAGSAGAEFHVERYNTLLDIKKGKTTAKVASPSLYTADLPDPMVERMLDWDKPLSEQPKAVQQIAQQLRQLPGDPYNLERYFNPKNPNKGPLGQEVYRAIAEHFQKDDAAWQTLGKTPYETTNIYDAASQYAAQLGIPGIKYLDAGSRGQGGTGTRNFVVFPGEETKVKILKRE